MQRRFIVGITGASGSVYAKRVIEKLLERDCQVHLCLTRAGELVTGSELGWTLPAENAARQSALRAQFHAGESLFCYDLDAIGSTIASGSFRTDGMIVLPCSMGTLSALATGASRNLLERAADVVLKERRPLVVVPREAPFSPIHLENMLTLARCGAVILPACPSFYSKPQSLDELVDFFAARALDQLGVEDESIPRWAGL